MYVPRSGGTSRTSSTSTARRSSGAAPLSAHRKAGETVNGSADATRLALIVIDMINTYDHEDA
ncbi:hypothetical protein ACFZAV_45550, partial [Streptomyces sp. NPDC008343]